MDILDIEIHKKDDYFSIKLYDKKENHIFWIDCGLIDGYGNRSDYKTDDLFIDWEYNQYIFLLDNENDLKAKKYQDNVNNTYKISEFIDENTEKILNIVKEGMMK